MSSNNYPSLTLLARSFPTFAPNGPRYEAAGVEPFDAEALHQASRSWDPIERVTADFLLSVFNAHAWKCDLQATVGAWDQDHRIAFAEWLRNLYWG